MKKIFIVLVIFPVFLLESCSKESNPCGPEIIFLHHSTGEIIWNGGNNSLFKRALRRVNPAIAESMFNNAQLPRLFDKYNKRNNKCYSISELAFPKSEPYGWHNYPYDYYNIWVKNAGDQPYLEEPTLEMLTEDYQVIIFKHCFPVSHVQADLDSCDVDSNFQTISNYKLQYLELREKLHTFPETKFIVFTGAALTKFFSAEEEASRAKEFFNWVTAEWDLPNDNIFIWDLYSLQTEGELYFKDGFALSPKDPHPNDEFAKRVVKLLFERIIDVIENDGNTTTLTGNKK